MKRNFATIILATWAIAATVFAIIKTNEANEQRKLASSAQAEVTKFKEEQAEQIRFTTQRREAAERATEEYKKQHPESDKK
jgi:hypothetical protein